MTDRTARACCATILLALLAVPAPATAKTIRMSGQPLTQALVADLAYFYRHEHPRRAPRFELTGGGTDAGIADTVRGISDAALVSRELAPDDPPGLVLTRLALSGVCLASNRANPVPGISRAVIQDIVAGRVTSWSQVPGAARSDAIVPVALDAGSGAAAVFEQVFLDDGTPIAWQPITVLTNAQARDTIARTPAAFGYLDLALTAPVHPLAFEGVPCARATIRNGSYPAARPIGVVTVGRPAGALRRFLRWARGDRTARRVIASRYIPVPRGR
jgi:phosphate transport system substrate-binding protein